jgi:hypothetical protein
MAIISSFKRIAYVHVYMSRLTTHPPTPTESCPGLLVAAALLLLCFELFTSTLLKACVLLGHS